MPDQSLPILLVPGLRCSARLYAPQIPALWQLGPVLIADHTRGDTITEIARHILERAPPRFALVGRSLGGYIACERRDVTRQPRSCNSRSSCTPAGVARTACAGNI